jgi:hypothetical protein
MSSDRITTARATEAHAEAVATFLREVWDPDATATSVVTGMRNAANANVAAPGTHPPTSLVLQGSRVIGYCSSIPQRLWDGVRERPAYWAKGLMVLPEFRNGPVGYLAVKDLLTDLPCSTVLTVAPAARRLFGALGYRDLGAVTNWVKPLRPGAIARQLDINALGLDRLPKWAVSAVRLAQATGLAAVAGATGGAVATLAARVARMPAIGLDVEAAVPSTNELDELWRTSRNDFAATPVRDATYLIPRYAGDPTGPYSFVAVRDSGRLAGAAVARRPKPTSDARLGNLRVATVSDIIFPPARTDVGLAILGAVERSARTAGADALTCMSSHPALTRLLRRQGYVRLGGNVHFFLRDVTGESAWPSDLSAWWLSRGDGESDETF